MERRKIGKRPAEDADIYNTSSSSSTNFLCNNNYNFDAMLLLSVVVDRTSLKRFPIPSISIRQSSIFFGRTIKFTCFNWASTRTMIVDRTLGFSSDSLMRLGLGFIWCPQVQAVSATIPIPIPIPIPRNEWLCCFAFCNMSICNCLEFEFVACFFTHNPPSAQVNCLAQITNANSVHISTQGAALRCTALHENSPPAPTLFPSNSSTSCHSCDSLILPLKQKICFFHFSECMFLASALTSY